jgi:hypothetical protein
LGSRGKIEAGLGYIARSYLKTITITMKESKQYAMEDVELEK